jgi:oxygen-independent coproporphyrinogen-3 oxidase
VDIRSLIKKYSVSGPRYTSYPTAPVWTEEHGMDAFRQELEAERRDPTKPLALYTHVPFCEQLCYYCGCNIQITKDHGRSARYVERVLREMGQVGKILGERRRLHQISWGGGTPTFLTLDEMRRLYQGTRDVFDIAPDAEVSIEVDPRVTSDAQLELLRSLGFNRVSLGVQDFDRKVQEAINRVQPREMTAGMLGTARRLGYTGINFDLIYGLPHQTLATFEDTVKAVSEIRPDRIALYNYAHLPNMIKHQGILDKHPMPGAEERVDIFTMAYDYLTRHGYQAIGMDHFALETDEMYKAIESRTLYRNFMGYTVKRGASMVGVGVSAISELESSFFQNIKGPKAYEDQIDGPGLATHRGCRLTPEDHRRKWAIQHLMCQFRFDFAEYAGRFGEDPEQHFADEFSRLSSFYDDGVLTRDGQGIYVTPLGRLFIRNVAMVFDAYLKAPKVTYSRTV